ncbi:MAG: PRC-barrel domain-containing protein [Acidobacteriota bacterium]|nr:PRC-barrel domain-containing protein [Acidobacteriota bacterium]
MAANQFESTRQKNNRPVLASSTITGDRVRNAAGEDLGKIEEIMLDVATGRIAYAVISFGGFLGIGDKLFAVPWKALQVDTGEHEFLLDLPRQTLETAPGFDKNDWPDMADTEFSGSVHKFYNQRPYWEQNFTDTGDYTGDNSQHNRSIEYEPVEAYRPTTKH